VFGVELFQTADDQVLVNEIAPRVHNSGHYTIEACAVSQFEQHIRAITGLPLGPTDLRVPAAVMINILGERDGPVELEGLDRALAMPGVAVHIYGKADTKVDRKMGHLTATGATTAEACQRAQKARNSITI
jgi:5-(carboxyamino)imidazole ribonucleotide synthase